MFKNRNIKKRFIEIFFMTAIVIGITVAAIVSKGFGDYTRDFSKKTLLELSQSIMHTMFVAALSGDRDVIKKALFDIKMSESIDSVVIYPSKSTIEIFDLPKTFNPPKEVRDVFDIKKDLMFETKTENKNYIRLIKPMFASNECLSCHTNENLGGVLAVMDLTSSLDKKNSYAKDAIIEIIISLVVITIISTILAYLIVKNIILDPIIELANAAKMLSGKASNFDVRLKIRYSNEVGLAAQYFNRFIKRVQNINRQLEDYKTKLEVKVKERTKKIEDLNKSLEDYVQIVDQNVIISKTDLTGKITYVSDAFCKISGYKREELIGKAHSIVRDPDMHSSIFEGLWKDLKEQKEWHGEIKNRRKDGSEYWVSATISPIRENGEDVTGYIAVRHDISDRIVLEKTIKELEIATEKSYTDPLTKLYNRNKIHSSLDIEIERNHRYSEQLSLIIIDLDHFKSINDTYGHNGGDIVLVEISNLILSKIRKVDILGRWGGEEFILIMPHTPLADAKQKAESLREYFEKHIIKEIGISVTASFGVGEYFSNESKTDFIHRVDKALYSAKKQGRNRVALG